jgi:hypothetical protein
MDLFKLDIQKLRNTSSDAEFRRLLTEQIKLSSIPEPLLEYIVEFKYYHYNTGMADNGTSTGFEKFKTVEEAKIFKDKLDLVYDLVYNEKEILDENMIEWYENLMHEWTACGGYLKSGGIIYVTTKIETKILIE